MEKPIPAFYCCYLLRAKNHRSYYIGSTPNPARRLGQHNGSSKGGAKRTSTHGRPWEMTCIVTGFPSRFAALQFEWAWQNTHMTRHIERDVRHARIDELTKNKKASPSKGKNPPMSLEARLKNLYYLLGVRSFNRWPLHLRFFSQDIFKLWEKHTAKMAPQLRTSIVIQLTPVEIPKLTSENATEDASFKIPDLIQAIPVAYEDCKSYVKKAQTMIEDGNLRSCGVCKGTIDVTTALVLVCPLEMCRAVCHMSCLSSRFMGEEDSRDSLIPIEGTCPSCRTPLKWSTLMKELSIRIRGQQKIEAMSGSNRQKKGDSTSEPEIADIQGLGEEDEDLDETWMEDVDEGA
jgi:structure-specific endonuclease subunit SLX1